MNGGLRGYIDSYKVDEEMLRAIPVGRVAIVAETAKLVRFLLCEDASYIAGQNVSCKSLDLILQTADYRQRIAVNTYLTVTPS